MRRKRIRGSKELKSSRRSVFYYWDLLAPEERRMLEKRRGAASRAFYGRMLVEDLENSLVPFRDESEGRDFQVVLQGAGPETEEVVTRAFAREDYFSGLTRAACDLIRECAQYILVHREAIQEIAFLSEAEGQGLVGFELITVNPATLFRRRGKLRQYVPPSVRAGRHLPEYIELPPQNVLVYRAPEPWNSQGGPMMEVLATIKAGIPDFAIQSVAHSTNAVPFDTQVHFSMERVVVAEATRMIGWNARGLLQEDMLDYYFVHRELVWERFKAHLRDGIVETINEGLRRAGQVLGFDTRLVIEGLPSEEEIDQAEQKLRTGLASFDEILKPFRLY
jgi:hypothetical protein